MATTQRTKVQGRHATVKSVWMVTVDNIGSVYNGNGRDAKRVYFVFCKQSKSNTGRAGGEKVILWKNNEPVKEYTPHNVWRIRNSYAEPTESWDFEKGEDEEAYFKFAGIVVGTAKQREQVAKEVLNTLNRLLK